MALVRASQTIRPPQEAAAQDLPVVLADLASPDASVRRAAARSLAAHPEGAMAACDQLEKETSPSVRAVLFTTLIHLQTPKVAERLSALLRSDDTPLRNAAIEALQEMPEAAASVLQSLLKDENSDVRIFAVNIIGALRHPQAPEWLGRVIRTDEHINVCAAAVDGLAEIGGTESLDDLEELRRRFKDNAFMNFAIDAAISRIRGL